MREECLAALADIQNRACYRMRHLHAPDGEVMTNWLPSWTQDYEEQGYRLCHQSCRFGTEEVEREGFIYLSIGLKIIDSLANPYAKGISESIAAALREAVRNGYVVPAAAPDASPDSPASEAPRPRA